MSSDRKVDPAFAARLTTYTKPMMAKELRLVSRKLSAAGAQEYSALLAAAADMIDGQKDGLARGAPITGRVKKRNRGVVALCILWTISCTALAAAGLSLGLWSFAAFMVACAVGFPALWLWIDSGVP